MNSQLKSIKRIMASEFVTKFTVMNILILVGVNLIAGLPSFFAQHLDKREVGTMFSQILGSVATYLLLISLFLTYRDRSSLDKNRAAYLNYSKHEVAFAKLLADICLFIVGLILGIIMTIFTIMIKMDKPIEGSHISKMIVWFLGLIFLYSFIMIGFKLILAAKMDKYLSAFSIISWLVLTVGGFLIMSIVSSLVADVKNAVIANKWVFAIVPILNFMIPSSVLTPNFDWYYVLPLIFETIIFIGIIWKTTASKLKLYFCV